MPKKIPPETKEEIIRLYDNGRGLNPLEIVRQTGVSYSSVYGLTRARQRINPETGQPFESLSQYEEYRARQRINPETGQLFESRCQYDEYRARQRVNPETGQLFESRSQYDEYRARQRINPETRQPFESKSQYEDYHARQKINPETGQHFESKSQLLDYHARQRINPETGQLFESLSQLLDYQARQLVDRAENKGLSVLIRTRLKELGKNQSWLAGEMGITHQAVSKYVQGTSVPTRDLLKRLYSSLDVPYETLDDLLEDLDGE